MDDHDTTEVTLTEDAVRNALRGVIDPELGDDIVSLNMVRSVEIGTEGRVTVGIALTIAGCPLRTQLRDDAVSHVGAIPGVTHVDIVMSEMTGDEKRALMERARWKARERE